MAGAFHRLTDSIRLSIEISIDGHPVEVLDGDTVLTAILLHHDHLRLSDVGGEPRAGFCLMGACQDCWINDGDGRRLRACTSYVRPGLAILTGRGDFTPAKPVPEPAPVEGTTDAPTAESATVASDGAENDAAASDAAETAPIATTDASTDDDVTEEGRS
jgi:hypothetical protein